VREDWQFGIFTVLRVTFCNLSTDQISGVANFQNSLLRHLVFIVKYCFTDFSSIFTMKTLSFLISTIFKKANFLSNTIYFLWSMLLVQLCLKIVFLSMAACLIVEVRHAWKQYINRQLSTKKIF